MHQNQHLVRRASGIYAVRLIVPERLRRAVGQRELHRSTGCRDLALARLVAAELLADWHRRLVQLRHMDPEKLRDGSIDLLGDGLMPLFAAAEALGASPLDLAQRLHHRRAWFYVQARAWEGWL